MFSHTLHSSLSKRGEGVFFLPFNFLVKTFFEKFKKDFTYFAKNSKWRYKKWLLFLINHGLMNCC